jgi:Ni,Fe-hydrogenase I small subunit
MSFGSVNAAKACAVNSTLQKLTKISKSIKVNQIPLCPKELLVPIAGVKRRK